MTDPTLAVQKAVYDTLKAALDTVSPSVARVYDHVPQNGVFPYVVLEEQEVLDYDYLNERKDERFFYISIWSRYRGQKEIWQIIQSIDSVLHNVRLTLDTGRMVICRISRKRTNKDADGVTYTAQITLRIYTEH